MKQSTLLIIALLFSFSLFAQKKAIKPGQIQLTAGIGLLSTYVADKTQTIIVPISISAEVFLSPNMAIGIYGGYSRIKGQSVFLNADLIENYDNTTRQIAVKTSFYSNDLNAWRIYGGFLTGISNSNIEKNSTSLKGEGDREFAPSFTRPNAPNSFLFSGYVGAQRKITNHINVYGELGFGISLVNVGLSSRF